MTHGALVYNNEKNAVKNDKILDSSSFSITQDKRSQDDNELEGSLLSFTI
jgi:hypothetical protein